MPTQKEEAAMRAVEKANTVRTRNQKPISYYIQLICLLPLLIIFTPIIWSIEWWTGEEFNFRTDRPAPKTPEEKQRHEELQQSHIAKHRKQQEQTLERGEKARAYLLERGYSV